MKKIQEKKFILNTSQHQTASTTSTNSPNRTSTTSTASTNSLTHLNRKTPQPESIKSTSKKIISANIAAIQERLGIIRIPESIKLAEQDRSSSNATTKD